ncbi:Tuberous sclerosis 2-like protein [Vanrija albida]|uniref:Tuberous sclerosis 2-like protein n=1 Tax=Vanrija albida TaxID=181172 RepID=A0ABR3Q8T1_9TREE
MSGGRGDRGLDRPELPPTSSSSSSVGALSFLPNLFGRRTSSKASTTTATAHAHGAKASASSSITRESFDEARLLASPPAGGLALLPGSISAQLPGSVTPTLPAFNLEGALATMEPGAAKSNAELVETVKATSVWIANNLYDHDSASPATTAPDLAEFGLTPQDVRLLYGHAMKFGAPDADYALRTAAIRLLAVLVAVAPPRESVLDPDPAGLPSWVTRRAVYVIVAAWSGGLPGWAYNEQMYVEVAALKALTRDGEIITGMEGVLGWLLNLLAGLKTDWTSWCSMGDDAPASTSNTKDAAFGPIHNATPPETAASLIDLAAAVIQHRVALFAPADISSLVRPMIEFIWIGILAAVSDPAGAQPMSAANSTHSNLGRRSTPGTTLSSPAAAFAPRTLDVRRGSSLTVGRVEPFPLTTSATPPKSPGRGRKHTVQWAGPFRSLCLLINTLFESSTLNDDLFDEVFELLCFAYGQDDRDAMMDTADASFNTSQLVRTMLGSKSGRRGELALRRALEGKLVISKTEGRRGIDVERKVTRGAVIIARQVTQDPEFVAQSGSLGLSFCSLAPSLVDAESTSRYPRAAPTEWARWQPVDSEILSLLDSHLSTLETNGLSESQGDDAWIQGEAACAILDGMSRLVQGASCVLVVGRVLTDSPEPSRTILRSSESPLVTTFGSILLRIPSVIGRLHSQLHTSTSPHAEAPQLAQLPPFYHPKHVALLLDLSPYLDEDAANVVIDYYERECLCLPFTSDWDKNIWKLLEAFCMSNDLPLARMRVSNMLYKDIYGYVQDHHESRDELVAKVLIPYLDRWLPDETDDGLLADALNVLVLAAVADTLAKDEERRRTVPKAQLDAEDLLPKPTEEFMKWLATGNFDQIRTLIIKLATTSRCKDGPGGRGSSQVSLQSMAQSPAPEKGERDSREGRSREASGLRNLMRTLSPTRAEPTPPSTANLQQLLSAPQKDKEAEEYFPPLVSSASTPQHQGCKSLHAAKALIAIFTRLAFTAPHGVAVEGEPLRCPTTARGIMIYRDCLNLLFPMADGTAASAMLAKVPARCPAARLTILSGGIRLRADRKHRLIFRDDINRFIYPYAASIYRTKETEEAVRTAMEQEEARRRARAQPAGRVGVGAGNADDERGRSARPGDASARSRSRSKAAGTLLRTASTATEPQSYSPLWCLPEAVIFETPLDNHPSDYFAVYDPNHPAAANQTVDHVEGLWLPVSDYLRVLNGLLRWEHDWELVSYVLCFLPQQLGNKHFFHGARAAHELRSLLSVLCGGILDSDNRWERRFNVPSFIKRPHINALAYQSLSILISYKNVMDRSECDRLLQSLVAGLEGNSMLAKPCLQALTICVYELEQNIAKLMPTILRKMQQILSTPVVAVHILEFLVALGNSNLYRNFTEDQYRLVFAVAIGYIAEHNTRTGSASAADFANSREAYTLSQHVIGLAYHAIYLWFLTLRVAQRPHYVSELVRGLIHAKTQGVAVDERNEVCFDWMSRYAYGNADPKPAQSFLSQVVMATGQEQPSKSQSWVLGGAIVTVTSHPRTGWATITTTRPTGQTSVVCKLENVPLLDLGEANADLVSLPATLMANREQKRDVNESNPAGDVSPGGRTPGDSTPASGSGPGPTPTDGLDPRKIVALKSSDPSPEQDPSLPAGFVWSGAAPSQRRKDVMVEPSYLAIQLLSSYPNNTIFAPRGQYVPREPKFERAIRTLHNTPVINTYKIAVLYVGPGQKTETEILSNTDGSPLYLDFLAGLGRVIKLKGQVDVYTGGLDTHNDTDGEYAYAWWDDLAQTVFHAPTLMPNVEHLPEYTNKKRLVGNDFVKIVYNESGNDFAFDTIKTSFNFVNIVISPYATRDMAEAGALARPTTDAPVRSSADEYLEDTEDYFKIMVQRAPGIPDFSPIGEYKLVSRRNLPNLVRQMALYANSMAVRFEECKKAVDAASAEYITLWRTRYQHIKRLKDMLPPLEGVDPKDAFETEEALRDFTKIFGQPTMSLGE